MPEYLLWFALAIFQPQDQWTLIEPEPMNLIDCMEKAGQLQRGVEQGNYLCYPREI